VPIGEEKMLVDRQLYPVGHVSTSSLAPRRTGALAIPCRTGKSRGKI
jgi:hypothetical protein